MIRSEAAAAFRGRLVFRRANERRHRPVPQNLFPWVRGQKHGPERPGPHHGRGEEAWVPEPAGAVAGRRALAEVVWVRSEYSLLLSMPSRTIRLPWPGSHRAARGKCFSVPHRSAVGCCMHTCGVGATKLVTASAYARETSSTEADCLSDPRTAAFRSGIGVAYGQCEATLCPAIG